MLKKIVDILLSSEFSIEAGTIFCKGVFVADESVVECIKFLNLNNAIENADFENKVGRSIKLELTLAWLNALGFYENCNVFLLRNKYSEPKRLYYILELNSYSDENSLFVRNYHAILNLIESVESISKHTYTDSDLKTAIIFSEENTLLLPFIYDEMICMAIKPLMTERILDIINVFKEAISEKKLLFLNQFIVFLKSIDERERFAFFIKNIVDYYEKGIVSYQYYLRDFSYNKLKIELDSKALEFAQKIQSVINDSQTKLIAIPTAFVLVVATFDFDKILVSKNIGAIISLFIFSVLIQLFINNQRSTLKFIKQNIDAYKDSFKGNEIEEMSNRFALVEIEFSKQDSRLKIIQVILWSIPVGMLCLSIYLLYSFLSIVFIYLAIIFTHAFLRAKWDSN